MLGRLLKVASTASFDISKSVLRNTIRTVSSNPICRQKLDTDTTGTNSLPLSVREPIITSRDVPRVPFMETPQAWLETLGSIQDSKLGLIDLHPDVFAASPRLDILHQNVRWQQAYKRISFAKTKTRAEKRGGGRKPWRQKGSGRARHGSIRSPLWKGGGKAHGPRGPRSYWYFLPTETRATGMRIMLSIKHAQDDLHIVDSLELPSSDPEYLIDIAKERCWGSSILFVDRKLLEDLPENFINAVNCVKTYNVMTMEGLNVYSMLKHQTLVLTLDVVDVLEEQLCYHQNCFKSKQQQQFKSIIQSQLQDRY
ncbi:39S ribosomal protein L4, mitochondrial-like [Anneissia japonica]|uniref:39S ribosomal protein L4, mitochondrial-like n=1 Tax=Anneissia japonica TaxID=1529436 RepID=UPI00142587F2|nr:39S ribosomal protein L4, mitochondrial-like [Anneissia japonica]